VILSDTEILAARERGEIVIEPFDLTALGGNSYDVRLSPYLKIHQTRWNHVKLREFESLWKYSWRDLLGTEEGKGESVLSGYMTDLDCRVEPRAADIQIPEDGIILIPGIMYLGSTLEYTETHGHVPYLDGRSSIGRLGVSVHETAGRGDAGFKNYWTYEITVAEPIRIYAGIKIGQLTYHSIQGKVERDHSTKSTTTYGTLERDPKPQPSRLWTKLVAEK
jgi:dCTP deaminase